MLKNISKRQLLKILPIFFVLVFMLRFVWGICNMCLCLSGIGAIVIWQILLDIIGQDDTGL